MINPSVHGWIDKFFLLEGTDGPSANLSEFYSDVRKTGFIYGYILSFYTEKDIDASGWLDDEKSKLALLIVLYRLHLYFRPNATADEFISKTVSYYREMNPKGFNFIHKILPGNHKSAQLERILDDRVQTNDNIVSKNFSHIVTNALLFLDVLGYQKFLEHEQLPAKYLKRSEELIISIVSIALQTKSGKSSYDELLIKLLDSSLRFGSYSEISKRTPDTLPLDFFTSELERYYLLDMAGLALYSDAVVEPQESIFLFQLGKSIGLSENHIRESLKTSDAFITENKSRISYFRYSNPVKHFYDHMSDNVTVLINRNKKRLAREISQSGELVKLLAASTTRDLDEKEKKKVRKQLLDICKSIPSLTIFLLPGGSLLMPILIKFIPQLLPSAFNENSETE
ncbi:LETM1-related biofilm-associated protein [Flavobacterium silvaticum]|uniref:Letm1 RBD domain-containing protein n=1 Tax=Flavobacterium silvaticum TaxID=1852020 RepID=A0A972FTK0_9FLAO|nr:LETM1-related biofilm-associated protein [Flavobacterium silvaticum]NMH27335.1 hypothetical protein [Flavobacterium silvaticum]